MQKQILIAFYIKQVFLMLLEEFLSNDIGKQIILLIYQAIKKIQYMHWQLLK
jgi:hypothetical protein